MRKIDIVIVLILGAFIPGCRPFTDFSAHRFKEAAVYQHSGNQQIIFTGLQNDDEDLLLEISSGGKINTLLIKDQAEKIISQINLSHKIRSTKVLTDPLTKGKWLFVGFNDQQKTYLRGFKYIWQNKLQREELDYESIARTDSITGKDYPEWMGTIIPEMIRDIDLDGKSELVCRTIDSFTVNPRGLAVYDLESGALNWRLDLSTNVNSIVCDDFDNDGNLELVCGNSATKNTLDVKQGMDDFNGWFFAVNGRGDLLHRQKVFEGFGSILLAADDPDRDGDRELQAVFTTWGKEDNFDSVHTYIYNGRSFIADKSWKLYGSFETNTPETFYHMLRPNDARRFMLVGKNSPLVVLDENLNPVKSKIGFLIKRVWDVEDINWDGQYEVLVQTRDDEFLILDSNMRVKAALPSPYGHDVDVSAHIVKSGMNSDCKIALTTSRELRYYEYAQERLPAILYSIVVKNKIIFNYFFFTLLLLMGFELFRRKIIFAFAIDKVEQGILVLGRGSKIQFMNRYLLDLLQEEHIISKELKKVSLESILPDVAKTVAGFKKTKSSNLTERICLGKDRIEYIIEYTKLMSLTRRFFILIRPMPIHHNDVSEAKLEWADTARRLSHNVRRHINNLILALKPIQNVVKDSENQQYAEIIRSEIDKIRIFTHAFQRFSELDKVELSLEEVVPIVERCVRKLALPEQIQVVLDFPSVPLHACMEPIRFAEALSNLLQNSVEAMPQGGVLNISVQEFPNHNIANKGLSVLVEIEDSGMGIPLRYMPEIWTPFFTTKDDGTGIGLPETRKNIESMGGTIDLQSEENIGTVVTIWLKGKSDE